MRFFKLYRYHLKDLIIFERMFLKQKNKMKTVIYGLAFSMVLTTFNVCAQKRAKNNSIEGVISKSILFNNITRTFDILVPSDNTFNLPLVLMLHGGGGNSKEAAFSTQWLEKAKKESFIIVFPNGSRPDTTKPASFRHNGQNWNDGSHRNLSSVKTNVDDVGFIRTLIDSLKTTYNIDDKKIYATGFSNGASMAFLLGIECADIFAAIAPVAGSFWLENPKLKNPISLIYITGDSDPLNPIEGGDIKIGMRSFGTKKPVVDIIELWVNLLNAKKIKDEQQKNIHKVHYQSPNAEILWITVKNLGHHWPGGKQTLPKWMMGKPSNSLNATDEIWNFFKNHPKE